MHNFIRDLHSLVGGWGQYKPGLACRVVKIKPSGTLIRLVTKSNVVMYSKLYFFFGWIVSKCGTLNSCRRFFHKSFFQFFSVILIQRNRGRRKRKERNNLANKKKERNFQKNSNGALKEEEEREKQKRERKKEKKKEIIR
jgi:hypothetical protein